jgi:hypothetical protein
VRGEKGSLRFDVVFFEVVLSISEFFLGFLRLVSW